MLGRVEERRRRGTRPCLHPVHHLGYTPESSRDSGVGDDPFMTTKSFFRMKVDTLVTDAIVLLTCPVESEKGAPP